MSSGSVQLGSNVNSGGGGSGAVDSFNGRTGAVVPLPGDYTASDIINVPSGGITATNVQDAINELDARVVTGTSNTFAGFDGSGNLESIPGFDIDVTTGGINEQITYQPNDLGGGYSLNTLGLSFDPLQNSPNDDWNLQNLFARFDVNSTGFTQGTGGEALTLSNLNIQHHGTGNIGAISMTKNYFDLGNGTDPVSINGFAYSFGFGDVNSGVTLTGPIQGYGFQPNVHAGATMFTGGTTFAFYDFANINVSSGGSYNSYIANPNITSIPNNSNYSGLNIGPVIPTFNGNAGFTGVGIFPQITTVGTPGQGSFQGLVVSPTITNNNNYAVGLNINMGGVTNTGGAHSTLVVQDITYTFNAVGDNNNIQITYTDTVPAGSEVATLAGNLITVQIQSGVSTATQVRTAFNANPTLLSNITATITGTASNAQTAFAATNFAGGVNSGRKLAIDVVGDVNINGALAFTGALAVGQINAFASFDLATANPGVNSIDGLITNPHLADNLTISGSDLIGVNTAMLLTVGNNSHITTSFLGLAALGLPAVVSLGTGSTVDRIEGAVFAISLDSGAAGGTIAEVDLCRAIAIPNGATSITRLKAYQFDLPFGDPGVTTFGVYMEPTAHNYMAGDLKVGGAPVSDDTPANASVGIELASTTKALLLSRMTTTQRDALTAINGMLIYNTTTNKFQGYEAGAWTNLI